MAVGVGRRHGAPAGGPPSWSAATPGRPASSSRRRSSAGLASAGADVVRLGVVPTPAVAYAVASSGADLGVMLSASHNPMPDNGIKLFAAAASSCPTTSRTRSRRYRRRAPPGSGRPTGADVGRVRLRTSPAPARPASTATSPPAERPADPARRPLTVVVDCAQGAASTLAPRVLREAGAEVIAIVRRRRRRAHQRRLRRHATSSAAGRRARARRRRRHRARRRRRPLPGRRRRRASSSTATRSWRCSPSRCATRAAADDTVVATVMSNLGFRHAMRDAGIAVRETPVGDRYVLEAMRAGGWHARRRAERARRVPRRTPPPATACSPRCCCSADGRHRRSLAELAAVMTRLPQVLINVRADRSRRQRARRAREAVADAEQRARRRRPGAAAPVRHRAAGPGHGRGDHRAGARVRPSGIAGVVAQRARLEPPGRCRLCEAGAPPA